MAEKSPNQADTGMSIGALSKETGIPVETLRTWERRYGFPNPDRNDAGHRVYSSSTVEKLRLIDTALKEGHRASAALQMSVPQLQEIALAVTTVVEEKGPTSWMDAVRDFDGERLEESMRREWATLGALPFLKKKLGPFLVELGIAWMNHEVDVAHEHFASERVRDFLTQHWRPISDRSKGPRVLAATLPSETHYLGLQMACTALAMSGTQIVYLGADTPVDDVIAAATTQFVDAVCISVSIAANRSMTVRDLNSLRRHLSSDIELVVGGLGAPDIDGITIIRDLEELQKWGEELSLQQRSRH